MTTYRKSKAREYLRGGRFLKMEALNYLPVSDRMLPNTRTKNWASLVKVYCRNKVWVLEKFLLSKDNISYYLISLK